MQCPSCSTTMTASETFCFHCGAQATVSSLSAMPGDASPYDGQVAFVEYTSTSFVPIDTPSIIASQHNIYAGAYTPHQSASDADQPTLPLRVIRSGSSTGQRLLLALLVVLVIVASSGLVYFLEVIHPNEMHTQAIAIRNALQVQMRNAATLDGLTPQQRYKRIISSQPTFTSTLADVSLTLFPQLNVQGSSDSCAITGGAYHITITQPRYYFYCSSPLNVGDNFMYQVNMTVIHGTSGSCVFRLRTSSSGTEQYYGFTVSSDGDFGFFLAQKGYTTQTLVQGVGISIKTGLGQDNLLSVLVLKDTAYLFVNQNYLARIQDIMPATPDDQVGVLATSGDQSSADVAFNNLKIWMF